MKQFLSAFWPAFPRSSQGPALAQGLRSLLVAFPGIKSVLWGLVAGVLWMVVLKVFRDPSAPVRSLWEMTQTSFGLASPTIERGLRFAQASVSSGIPAALAVVMLLLKVLYDIRLLTHLSNLLQKDVGAVTPTDLASLPTRSAMRVLPVLAGLVCAAGAVLFLCALLPVNIQSVESSAASLASFYDMTFLGVVPLFGYVALTFSHDLSWYRHVIPQELRKNLATETLEVNGYMADYLTEALHQRRAAEVTPA